jgi:two-component system NtrC family sensor kinase
MVKFRKSLHSLAGKLILTVGALMTLGSLLLGYFFITYERKVMMQNIMNYAVSSTELIKRGIHYGMLTGRKDMIQQNVDMLSMDKSIIFVRVYNPQGQIVYASNKKEIGKSPYKPAEFQAMVNAKQLAGLVDSGEDKVLRYAVPLYNEPRCFTSQCHYHPKDERVLGVLESAFATSEIGYILQQNRITTLLLIGLFIFGISVFLCIILYQFVSKPVALLEAGMKKIAKGELDEPIDIKTKDEMGLLAETFNSMAKDLKRYRENMENWTRSLEAEVKKKTDEIMRAQEELLNAEKLASLGRMAAGVAHELNSPLTGVVTFAHLLKSRTSPEDAQAHEDLQVIIDQANRCSRIIKGLLGFSRRAGFEMVEINVNDLLDNTISLVRNQARFHNIRFDIRLAPSLPLILADPNQLQQVFLNLIINAADAMNEKGIITIATRLLRAENETLEIEITDNGPGIPEDMIGRIFEPFFTTKPVGKGTGLGLSVSYGIIKRHGGDIIVKSAPGQGASLFIRIPAQRKKPEEHA